MIRPDIINFSLMTHNEITLVLLIQGILTVKQVIHLRIEYEQNIIKNLNYYGKN